MTRPQRAPYAFPPSYDADTKVWVQLERDALPFVLGATLGLLKRGAWGSEADWRSGSQMALRTQESLMSVSRAHATQVLLDEQATAPTAPASGQLVIYADNGSILRTIRPGGSQGQIAELDRAQTWSDVQTVRGTSSDGVLVRILNHADAPVSPPPTGRQLEISAAGQAGMGFDAVSDTAGVPSKMYLGRSRGTPAQRTTVNSGDFVGEIDFGAYDGTANRLSARIVAVVTGTPANNRVPAELQLYTAGTDHDVRITVRLRPTGATWFGNISSSTLDSDGDVTAAGRMKATGYYVGTNQVIGARGAAVPDASGGTVVDIEARTSLNALLSRLRAHGLIA